MRCEEGKCEGNAFAVGGVMEEEVEWVLVEDEVCNMGGMGVCIERGRLEMEEKEERLEDLVVPAVQLLFSTILSETVLSSVNIQLMIASVVAEGQLEALFNREVKSPC